MPVETGTTIADLNSTNPPSGDPLSQIDEHLRLIKKLIKDTFPNINGVVNATDEQLNELAAKTIGFADGSGVLPSMAFLSELTSGFYRPAAGKIGIATGKRLQGNGAVPMGALAAFLKAPAGLGTASGAGFEWLEINGAIYNISDYPDLGAHYGATFGGNGVTTFGMPNAYDTGRFLRSRSASLTVGTAQANVLKSHTHVVSGSAASAGSHTHTATVTDLTHTHAIAIQQGTTFHGGTGSVAKTTMDPGGSTATGNNGTTPVSVANAADGAHTHTVSGTAEATGDTETRPESLVVIYAVKT